MQKNISVIKQKVKSTLFLVKCSTYNTVSILCSNDQISVKTLVLL